MEERKKKKTGRWRKWKNWNNSFNFTPPSLFMESCRLFL